jgi:hypothetical protein
MAAAAGALLLAGCGSSGSHQTTAQATRTPEAAASGGGGTGAGTGTSAKASPAAKAPAGTPSPSAALTVCPATELTVTLDSSQAGGTAGSTYVPLNFANSSGSACELFGFPGASFVSTSGAQLGVPATRDPQFRAEEIVLAPGHFAHAWLQVAVAANYPAGTCHPVTAHALRVYPPGATVARFVFGSFDACRSPSAPVLTITAVRAGRGVQGDIP